MEATGKCAGGIRYQFSTEINVRLSLLSLPMLERFHDELGQDIDLHWPGYLFLLDNQADLATFQRNVAMQNRLGVPSQIIARDEAQALAPLLQMDDILAAAWHAGDGLADPNGVVQGYAMGARRLGAKTLTNVEATGIQGQGGGR
jgi:sarcosine oxidase, subunit beta